MNHVALWQKLDFKSVFFTLMDNILKLKTYQYLFIS